MIIMMKAVKNDFVIYVLGAFLSASKIKIYHEIGDLSSEPLIPFREKQIPRKMQLPYSHR